MNPLGWCPICEISLYLKTPSGRQPLICSECLPKLIGKYVICLQCVKAAFLLAKANDWPEHKLDAAIDVIQEQTETQLDEDRLSTPKVKFLPCRHEVTLLSLLRSPVLCESV